MRQTGVRRLHRQAETDVESADGKSGDTGRGKKFKQTILEETGLRQMWTDNQEWEKGEM